MSVDSVGFEAVGRLDHGAGTHATFGLGTQLAIAGDGRHVGPAGGRDDGVDQWATAPAAMDAARQAVALVGSGSAGLPADALRAVAVIQRGGPDAPFQLHLVQVEARPDAPADAGRPEAFLDFLDGQVTVAGMVAADGSDVPSTLALSRPAGGHGSEARTPLAPRDPGGIQEASADPGDAPDASTGEAGDGPEPARWRTLARRAAAPTVAGLALAGGALGARRAARGPLVSMGLAMAGVGTAAGTAGERLVPDVRLGERSIVTGQGVAIGVAAATGTVAGVRGAQALHAHRGLDYISFLPARRHAIGLGAAAAGMLAGSTIAGPALGAATASRTDETSATR